MNDPVSIFYVAQTQHEGARKNIGVAVGQVRATRQEAENDLAKMGNAAGLYVIGIEALSNDTAAGFNDLLATA
jgi:hypothetical protein